MQLAERLVDVLGATVVSIDPLDCELSASDIYSAGATPAAVVRPTDTAELSLAVRTATAAGAAVVPRGGGVSYTGGVVAPATDTVVIDTSSMDRILKIDADAMFVTVEVGCTWQALWEALGARGLRTPFFGPLSGSKATVGGSVSQGAALWGSGRYGTSADSVLGLEVVLADGTVLSTGMGAVGDATPSFRNFGPDLTGPFLGDAGALGIKATVTLRLMRTPAASGFATYTFDDRHELVDAIAELARADLAASGFALDPALTEQRIRRGSLAQGIDAVREMVGRSDRKLGAIRDAVRMAAKGRGFLAPDTYTLHLLAEGRSQAAVDADLEAIAAICAAGTPAEPTVPQLLASRPFASLTSALGPEGQRWAPLHVLVPVSEANSTCDRIDGWLQHHAAQMAEHHIEAGYMLSSISTTTMLIELVMIWPGERPAYYDRLVDASKLKRYPDYEDDPAASQAVAELRDELVDLFVDVGGAHLQIGRRYRYLDRLDEPIRRLLHDIKAAVDPHDRINPGVLGLGKRTHEENT